MPAEATIVRPKTGGTVGRRPKEKGDGDSPKGREAIGKQIGIRMSDDLTADLKFIAESLGLEVGPLIRLIVSENIAPYLRRAHEAVEKRKAARGEGQGEK